MSRYVATTWSERSSSTASSHSKATGMLLVWFSGKKTGLCVWYLQHDTKTGQCGSPMSQKATKRGPTFDNHSKKSFRRFLFSVYFCPLSCAFGITWHILWRWPVKSTDNNNKNNTQRETSQSLKRDALRKEIHHYVYYNNFRSNVIFLLPLNIHNVNKLLIIPSMLLDIGYILHRLIALAARRIPLI